MKFTSVNYLQKIRFANVVNFTFTPEVCLFDEIFHVDYV